MLKHRTLMIHLIIFLVGVLAAVLFSESLITSTRAFIEFRIGVYKENRFGNIFSPVENSDGFLIPNYIHYIRINQSELRFFEAVCMKSAFIIQRPEKLFVHTTDLDLSGGYWDTLKKIPGFKEALVVKRIIEPDQIHGVQFYWTAHKADVVRLLVLKKYGGIYLDNDIYVINSLDQYRRYEFVLGWPPGEWIGNMMMMANKHARFLYHILDTYKMYRPDVWYYNGGEKPVKEILSLYPGLVHNEPHRLGVTTNIAHFFYVEKQLWDPEVWTFYYDSLHLLIGHRPDIDPRYDECTEFTEENIRWLDMSVAMMFRYTWFGSILPISNQTKINMAEVNRRWIQSKGDHRFMWDWAKHYYKSS
ncbi:uncharacterized protein LOC111695693 [Eurytemora carolleeae]|uniref:uncharacterized protein LOC111695693 n=1 Tax=Eurytemora carolleeae TaxID=1294199 RepID=UPI000C77516F|nr:uncharacterized protein LOC111695693 [Eurytemora carolleeae]|eukprot:XP_023320869.1 uncharacterized protein LOC111695693 [Eurytemora affinis]